MVVIVVIIVPHSSIPYEPKVRNPISPLPSVYTPRSPRMVGSGLEGLRLEP